MKVRILSGILKTRDVEGGNAVIEFKNNNLIDPIEGISLVEARTAGDEMPTTGEFLKEPTYTVSIREFKVVETELTMGPGSHRTQEVDRFVINGEVSKSTLSIRWDASAGGSRIEEISYMIIGDVAED